MTAHSELLEWAKAEGFQLNGIQPASISGCGTGIIASRKLMVSKFPPDDLYSN